MINFNRFHINILSVFISLLIFSTIILLMENPKSNFIENENTLNENNSISIYNAQNEEDVSDKNWYIEIEDLNLKANIKELEGLDPDDNFVGHIKATSKFEESIALIAYNFGKQNNYFANLKELNVGDKIKYTLNNKVREYKVIFNTIIDKENLENILKEESKTCYIKLFTYIKDMPTKLRYVCGIIDI